MLIFACHKYTAYPDIDPHVLEITSYELSFTHKLIHKHSAGAGEVSIISAVNMENNRFITAVRDGIGNLKIIPWELAADGHISRLHEGAQAGEVRIISAINMENNRFITAVRDGGGNLKIIPWELAADGNISRLHEGAQAGKISVPISEKWTHINQYLSAVKVEGQHFITAVRDGGGNLKIIPWELAADGHISRLHEGAQAGKVGVLSAVYMGKGYLVTSVEGGIGNLEIISWKINNDGEITKVNAIQDGSIGPSIAAVDEMGDLLVTVAHDESLHANGAGIFIISYVDSEGNVSMKGSDRTPPAGIWETAGYWSLNLFKVTL